MSDTKTCKTCGVEKPTSDYARHGKTADGFNPHCRPCMAAKLSTGHRDGKPTMKAINVKPKMKPAKTAERQHFVKKARPDLATAPVPTGETRESVLTSALECIATGTVLRDGQRVRQELGPTGLRDLAAAALARARDIPAAVASVPKYLDTGKAEWHGNGNGNKKGDKDATAALKAEIAAACADRDALAAIMHTLLAGGDLLTFKEAQTLARLGVLTGGDHA